MPSRGDDVNKEDRPVPASLPRIDFYHWVLVDLPPDAPGIARGEFSEGVTARGKPGPHAPRGARQGVNNYTDWFGGDKDIGSKCRRLRRTLSAVERRVAASIRVHPLRP